MSWLVNFVRVPIKGLFIFLGALLSLLRLLGLGLAALFGAGNLSGRLAARFGSTDAQRLIFAVLRALAPTLVLSKRIVTAYENTGTAVVTRDEDVREILDHDDVFQVVYEPKMRKITGGANFFLGMQDTPEYTRDVSDMRLAARREDVAEILIPFLAAESAKLVAEQSGRIDVPQQLSLRVPARMVGHYFGTPGPSEQALIDWTIRLFWYLFVDLAGDAEVEEKALAAGSELQAYLDKTIAERKAQGVHKEDVLGRCLGLQSGKAPGMDDLGIRNNLIGLTIGAIPTIGSSCALALDQLLDRPDRLREAQAAARNNDDALLAKYIFEAFRFQPLNPIIYRRAVADYVVAKGTLRARKIRKDTMVLAANLSAMFDAWTVRSPSSFRIDRPWDSYILWGYGLHACFGAHINYAAMPQILKPLLQKDGLRRAAGAEGKLDKGGTPFPVHMVLEFD